MISGLTLDDGTNLYLGFTLVASEDANTLLDVTINLFRKISQCHSGFSNQDTSSTLKNLLRKIKSTMTDRASAMKLFDKKLQDFLRSELGADVEISFLHCNAHFLLRFSDSCEKAFKKIEAEIRESSNEPIGRDKHPQFSRFASDGETCVSRLIRTLCDVLGPRGDQKNGRRVEWKEFCPDSKITSFKGNRFNCFFESAAAIVHHYKRIRTFFTSGVLAEKPNMKIESVGLDTADKNLISCICALAFFYLKVSGPYWALVTSSVPNEQFCRQIQGMHSKFVTWAESDEAFHSEIFDCDFTCVFDSKFSLLSSPFYASVHAFIQSDSCDLNLVIRCLKVMSEECILVTVRQLGSFIDGSFIPSESQLADILKNCPFTNLIGESSFGDLDYDIKKRPNCSNLQRTAQHCVRRNKTASVYLNSKSKTDRALLFSTARKQRYALVADARSQQAEVAIKVKEIMAVNLQQKINKTGKHCETKGKVNSQGELNRMVGSVATAGKLMHF